MFVSKVALIALGGGGRARYLPCFLETKETKQAEVVRRGRGRTGAELSLLRNRESVSEALPVKPVSVHSPASVS